jgi:tetratricopeptide (TPR) repeat protein
LSHLSAAATANTPPQIKAEIYRQEGFVYYALARYREARQAFERSLEHAVGDVVAYAALGETCMKLQAFEDAVNYLKRGLALTEAAAQQTPDPAAGGDDRHRILMALGHGYLKLGEPARAVEAFREAAHIKGDVSTLTTLADALTRIDRPVEAAALLERVADRDAGGDVHRRLGTIYTKLQYWDRALSHLSAAATANTTPQIKAEIYRQEGFVYYAVARYREARQAFERSLEHTAGDVVVYTALGETCMKLQAFEDAVNYLKRGLALTEATAQQTLDPAAGIRESVSPGATAARPRRVR